MTGIQKIIVTGGANLSAQLCPPCLHNPLPDVHVTVKFFDKLTSTRVIALNIEEILATRLSWLLEILMQPW